MSTDSSPVGSTGPASTAITSLHSLLNRIEAAELAIKRLQANRAQPNPLLSQLKNCDPMSKVKDGQVPTFQKSSGKYHPVTPGSSSGGYLSLTGAGQGASPGDLAQAGGLDVTVDTGSFGGFVVTNHSSHQGINLVNQAAGVLTSISDPVGGGISLNTSGTLSLEGDVAVHIQGAIIRLVTTGGGVLVGGGSDDLGFFGTTPVSGPQTITGSRGGNAALTSLLTWLANLGLIVNSTSP